MAAAWQVQMRATLLRNWKIKTRDGGRTLQEIFLPMYILLLLVFMKVVQPVLNLPALPNQPITDATCNTLDGGGSACWEEADRPYAETVLAFVPSGAALQNIVQSAANFLEATYPDLPTLTVRGYSSEAELVTSYNQNAGTIFAGLVFNIPEQASALPSDIEYTIRINGSYLPSSSDNDSPVDKSSCRPSEADSYALPTQCPTQRYLTSGLLALEGAVAHALGAAELPVSCGMAESTGGGLGHMHAQQRPLPPYDRGFASVRFRLFAAMYMAWALAPVLQSVVSEIVHEKDALIKDCLLQMGLIESVYWLAWLATFAVTAAITAAVVVAIAWATALFEASSILLMFALIYLFLLSLVALGLALSALFTKARSASAAGFLLMVLGSVTIIPVDLLNLSSGICGVFSLFSPVAFVLAIDTTVIAEGSGEGIHQGTLFSRTVGNDPGDPQHPLSVGGALCLIVTDTLLYLVLAWYLDNVWPHPGRGAKRRWNFIFSKTYWSPPPEGYQRLGSRRNTDAGVVELEQLDGGEAEDELEGSNLQLAIREDALDEEPVEPSLAGKAAVNFSNLRKVYPPRRLGLIGRSLALLTSWWPFGRGRGGAYQRQRDSGKRSSKPTVAVKGLTLNLFEGQVFAFLGHTGSGKSSVLNMLMGLVRPTSGEAYVYSHRVTQAGPALHSGSLLGICPQSNVNSGFLTVSEQLAYFATIKGENAALSHVAPGPDGAAATPPEVARSVQSILAELGLAEQSADLVRTLNESARRKLSIGLALVGDPQVVVVDEPTRNLDPVSRSQIWDALLKRRSNGQCVVITTDSMDEADILADRKAILSHGVVKCCGSSLFLKNKFGLSYLLHVTKSESFDAPAVLGLIQSSLPEALPVPGTRGDHATYRLPLGRSSEVATMMMELTERAEQVGVTGGALESTTLEEIFMQFAGEAEEEASSLPLLLESAPSRPPGNDEDTTQESLLRSNAELEGTSGNDDRIDIGFDAEASGKRGTFRQQFVAVVKMRVKTYRRSGGLLFNTVGMALIFTLVAILIQVAYRDRAEDPVHLVNPDYGNAIPVFYSPPAGMQNASQVESVLRHFGPNIHQHDPASLQAALSSAASGAIPDFAAVSFDTLDLRGCSARYTVLYQPWQMHQLPTLAAMLDSAILKTMNELTGAVTSLSVWSKALPYLDSEYIFGYFVAAFVCLTSLLIPPQLGGLVVLEREIGLRPLLRTAGLRSFPFWLGTWLGDALFMAITYQLVYMLGYSFRRTPFLKPASPVMLVLNILAPKAQLLMVYVWTYNMKNGLAAASNMSVLFFMMAVLPYFFMLTIWADGTSSIVPFHTIMSFINPPYALLAGYHFINYTNARLSGKNGEGPPASVSPGAYFAWDTQIPVTLIGLTAAGLLYALRLWHLEVKATEPESRQESPTELSDASAEPPLDPEIATEKQKVMQKGAAWGTMAQSETETQEQEDALILCYGLGKTYAPVIEDTAIAPPVVALQSFWLSVGAGEIIVLVGPEHAGKSTLLACLAGTEAVTQGDALICGQSVRYSYEFWNGGKVGYCPEGDVVASAMTIREHLQMFASIKGLSSSGQLAVDSALLAADISAEDAKQLARNSSVGTLRKLQLAITLMGGPRVLLLDEPTFGMDAAGRQAVWSQIKAGSAGRATLVCSSSVEEAEALGTQVGVLVKGRLRCLGSPQSIKKKYGSDYSLIVRAHPSKLPAIRHFINTLFPSTSSSSSHGNGHFENLASGSDSGGQARFGVPIQTLPELAMLLHELETKRASLGIEDYSVSQPTLQQAFFRLSKEEAGHQEGQN